MTKSGIIDMVASGRMIGAGTYNHRTTVTAGAYRYIRHPLYSSLLFLAWGVAYKSPGWLNMLLASIATLFLVATARAEEAEDICFFGPAYQEYMTQTKMFTPFLF